MSVDKVLPPNIHSKSAWLAHGFLFASAWVLLTQGRLDSWVIGVIVVPAATWCALRLFPVNKNLSKPKISFNAAVSLLPFFAIQSVKGGWDSAMLAINPGRLLNPAVIRFKTTLPVGRPRLFFTNLVSILPGTISAGWRGDEVWVHVLNVHADNESALRLCERKIASLFNLALSDFSAPPGSGLPDGSTEFEHVRQGEKTESNSKIEKGTSL